MRAFQRLEGLVAPMDRANVDTDLIIPKQFLKSIRRTGFGPNLFDELRYLDEGQPDSDCSGRPLNTDSRSIFPVTRVQVSFSLEKTLAAVRVENTRLGLWTVRAFARLSLPALQIFSGPTVLKMGCCP